MRRIPAHRWAALPGGRRRVATLGLAAVALAVGPVLLAPAPAGAQETRVADCRILPGTRSATGRTAGGARIIFVGRPRLACDGGVRINADSMVAFESTGFNQLLGNVDFEDADRRLLARNARYFNQVGRLEADGDVQLTDKASGNVVRGQNLLYLRAGFGRTEEELTVWGGRARALLYPDAPPRERTGERRVSLPGEGEGRGALEGNPYDVTADRIFIRGEDVVRATGDVEAVRDSLTALADTLRYDQRRERIILTRDARLDREVYDLYGDEIFVDLPGDTIRRVEARGQARLLGEDLDLDAPFIRMGFEAGALEGLWATPLRPGQELEMMVGLRTLPEELDSLSLRRPRGVSSTFEIEADSLEVVAPAEILERMNAVGAARAVSSARDSINTPDTPDLIRHDWMEGDTVVAIFARRTGGGPREGGAAPGDAGTGAGADAGSDSTAYVLERLEARGNAASLYRLDSDSTAAEAGPDPATPADSAGAAPGGADATGGQAVVASGDTATAGARVAEAKRAVAGDSAAAAAPDAGDEDQVTTIRPGQRPAVHYVTAAEIIIRFLDGRVDRMEVRGLKQGVHMDPSGTPRRAVARSDGREADPRPAPAGAAPGGRP